MINYREREESRTLPVKLTSFEKIQLYLFNNDDEIPVYHKLTNQERKKKERYANVFTYWLDKPTLSDKQIIAYMKSELKMSKSQAYLDLPYIKILLGNVRNAEKAWQRFKVIAMIDKAYELAERAKNPTAILQAADKLGKYTQLDKEETQQIPYNEIVPQSFEITGNVEVLGIKKIDDLRIKQKLLRRKYGGALIEEAEEADE